jgi:predicted dehydrogenase
MKVCFIGACGHTRQAHRYLKSRRDVILCGIAPESEDEGLVRSFDPDVPFFKDYKEMLDKERPDLAVISPVFCHTGRVIIECASRGIDVFAEKPVAASIDELAAVETAMRESGIRFSAMHYLRYTPAFYHGARMVRSGKIGEVKLINAQKSYKFGTRPGWYGKRELYGGTIPWVGIHAIDWIYDFTGKKFLTVRASASGTSPEMAALCQFEMEGGALASASIDYYRPSEAPTHGDDRIRCVGTRGVIEIRDDTIILTSEGGVSTLTPDAAPELLEQFIDGKDAITPEEIFYLTRVAILARESADTQKSIKIEG